MTNDADQQGSARGAIGVGRPLDELCKVVKKGEFDWVFRIFLFLRKGFGGSNKEEAASDDTEDGSSPDLVQINAKDGTTTTRGSHITVILPLPHIDH